MGETTGLAELLGRFGPAGRLRHTHEAVERRVQAIATRRHPQDGMDVGEVVVHPRAMHADDAVEALLHRTQAARGHAECGTQVSEVVGVARRGDRVEQRRDRIGKVFVDVGIRPERHGRSSSCGGRGRGAHRRDRAALEDPKATVRVDRPFDVLRRARQPFKIEPETSEVEEPPRSERLSNARGSSGIGKINQHRDRKAVARDAKSSGIHAAGYQSVTEPLAVLDEQVV